MQPKTCIIFDPCLQKIDGPRRRRLLRLC